ncbi:hypothetical protein [Saccharolobus shibatae]|uniref:hypothetical protein n=1 Tax=Saccharolobus shibatae TaxID=2286 RepID=UPI001C45C529|nr:hypothetical protein [Saccharolobus shibatae]
MKNPVLYSLPNANYNESVNQISLPNGAAQLLSYQPELNKYAILKQVKSEFLYRLSLHHHFNHFMFNHDLV